VVKRAGLVVLGAYVGVIGAIVHRHVWWAGGVQWPWGLVLVAAATYAVAFASGRVVPVGAAWFGIGWAVVLMAQQLVPGDSYLVASDWLGWSYTIACLGVIIVAVARPPRLER
jgi:hypothetical protein